MLNLHFESNELQRGFEGRSFEHQNFVNKVLIQLSIFINFIPIYIYPVLEPEVTFYPLSRWVETAIWVELETTNTGASI